VISITIGITLIETSTNTQEVYLRYDNVCTPNKNSKDNSANSPCRLTFTLTSPLPAPVYFYYGFKGFYQNHRRYLKYYSNNQLSTGDPYVSSVSLCRCRGRRTVQTTTRTSRPLEITCTQ
jgi:hypothetical protein